MSELAVASSPVPSELPSSRSKGITSGKVNLLPVHTNNMKQGIANSDTDWEGALVYRGSPTCKDLL